MNGGGRGVVGILGAMGSPRVTRQCERKWAALEAGITGRIQLYVCVCVCIQSSICISGRLVPGP